MSHSFYVDVRGGGQALVQWFKHIVPGADVRGSGLIVEIGSVGGRAPVEASGSLDVDHQVDAGNAAAFITSLGSSVVLGARH